MCEKRYYHYCDYKKFKDIIEKDVLYLVDPRIQNDDKEMRYFCDVLIPKVDAELGECFAYKYFIDEYSNNDPHLFIKCLSENCKDEKMWDEYANNGTGVALKLDVDSLIKDNQGLEICKINYVEDCIDEENKKKVKEFLYNLKKKSDLIPNIIDEILFKSLEYKSSCWSNENETRLIYRVNGSFELNRVGSFDSSNKIQYFTLKNIKKYITQVIIGKNCMFNKDIIKKYLIDIGYSPYIDVINYEDI